MADTLKDRLAGSTLKVALLEMVATEDLDQIPPDFDNKARFVICAVRAVARRADSCGFSVFVYSDAPVPEGKPHGFDRILHMQDGLGVVSRKIILTGCGANNGACRAVANEALECFMDELEALNLGDRATVIWDSTARTATVYPEGTVNDQVHARFLVPQSDTELTQDEVCEVLNTIYDDNLNNTSGHTAKLWPRGKLVTTAEDEIERHLKGQIAMFFAGRARPIVVISQTPTAAGRTDLLLAQKVPTGGLLLSGVLELKVLRGPFKSDYGATTEGLSQGYHYRESLQVRFATLALYDVADSPSGDTQPLLQGQETDHVALVRVRRFPIYNSPKAWRDAGGPKAVQTAANTSSVSASS
jgi:hypothetical protein